MEKSKIKYICNTNWGKGNSGSFVRFYDNDNVKIFEIEISQRNPLNYLITIKDRNNCIYWKKIYEKLNIFGYEKRDVDKMLEERYNKINFLKR